MTCTITLPWPDPKLSPNARCNWRTKGRAVKAAKDTAWKLGLAAEAHKVATDALSVRITFHPPDRHRRDDDNMIASLKAARDGIALAACVDDAFWTVSYVFAEVRKGGAVVVELSPPEQREGTAK